MSAIDIAVDEIYGAYDNAMDEISELLAFALDYNKNPNFSKMSMNRVKQRISEIIEELQMSIADILPELAEDIATESNNEVFYAYLLGMGLSDSDINEIPQDVISGAIDDLEDSIIAATNTTLHSIFNIINDVHSKHLLIGSLISSGNDKAANEIINTITGAILSMAISKALVGIVDSLGRKWNILTYIEMLLKTLLQKLYIDVYKDWVMNTGTCDLALIPFVKTVDECYYFQGLIISMTGATSGYLTYDGLQSTGMIFHPRCRHTPSPIFDIAKLDNETIATHLEVYDNVKNILS